MTTAATTSPARSAPRSPRPEYEGLFREPVYVDGGPYDRSDDDEGDR